MTSDDIKILGAGDNLTAQARLLAGRALAWEGVADWRAALRDYDTALESARAAG